jgi:hypothetical protein
MARKSRFPFRLASKVKLIFGLTDACYTVAITLFASFLDALQSNSAYVPQLDDDVGS